VSHLNDKRPLGLPVAVVSVLLLVVAGAMGALAGRHLWLLIVATALWAPFQAMADAAGALRMPVAMAALGMLLSAIAGGTSPYGALWRGVLFLAGAAWVALWEIARHPPWRSADEGTRELAFGKLTRSWRESWRFALLLTVPTTLAAGVAGAFEISHGAWMATTVLRVLRPDRADTISRSWRRLIGTCAGALLAALLLAAVPAPGTAVIVLILALTAMHLAGPKRYGIYTFFLTLIALQLSSVGRAPHLGIALIRVILTLAGTAVAVASGLIYASGHRHHH
jgi:Fusaric acid resistance protein-like